MNNKGITLVALVITIIVLLILASTATFVGYDAIETSKEQRFLTQLKEVNDAVFLHLEDYEDLGLTALENNYIANEKEYQYRLETAEDYQKIGLQNISDIIYVNFEQGEIYSLNGINNKHTLEDFGIEYYKPEKEENEQADVSFNVTLESQEYTWKYIVNDIDIVCNGNVANGNLFYSEYIDGTNYSWKRVDRVTNGYELEIKNPGIYELKFKDETGQESNLKEIYAYVKDGLELYYDGTYNSIDENGNISHDSTATTWSDLSGNENDGNISNCTWNNDKSLNMDVSSTLYSSNAVNITDATIESILKNNGELAISRNINNGTITANTNLDIGLFLNNNESSHYRGNIYNFRIYNRTLSEEEITKNYEIDKIRYNLQD